VKQKIIDIDVTHAKFLEDGSSSFIVPEEDVVEYEEDRDPPDHEQWLKQIERVQEETGWKDIESPK
jgi:hypothetical protein